MLHACAARFGVTAENFCKISEQLNKSYLKNPCPICHIKHESYREANKDKFTFTCTLLHIEVGLGNDIRILYLDQ